MKRYSLVLIIGLLVVVWAAGCAGAPAPTATPAATATPLIPTFSFVQPTVAPAVATAAAAQAQSGAEQAQAVERGRDRYVALGCAECHGDDGAGETPLTASTLSEEDFIALMRSGGDMGEEHQYATNRLSESGGRNLYQYLVSLRGGS